MLLGFIFINCVFVLPKYSNSFAVLCRNDFNQAKPTEFLGFSGVEDIAQGNVLTSNTNKQTVTRDLYIHREGLLTALCFGTSSIQLTELLTTQKFSV